MALPSIQTPSRRKRGRGREEATIVAPPVSVLTLVSADWNFGDGYLYLSFDRAIDISAINPVLITVDDYDLAQYHLQGDPAGASLADANTLRLVMEAVDPIYGTGVTLTAPGDTGIVAVDDGASWDGVTGLELPFG